MNKKKFESLPDDVQKIIEENSGLTLSRAHGKSFDQSYTKMRQICLKTGLQEVSFPDAEMQKLIKLTDPLKVKWVKDMEAKGLPGKAVLETVTRFSGE